MREVLGFGKMGSRSRPAATGPYTPISGLGEDLLGYWDAIYPETMTIGAGSVVSSWFDLVGGYELSQVINSAKPIYSATSFNGGPALTFDGMDDELGMFPTPASFPSLSTGNESIPTETWILIDQQSGTGQRSVTSMGGGQASVRSLQTLSTAIPNAATGDGAATTFVPAVAINARCVIRCEFGATATNIHLNGTPYTPKTVTPRTGGRMRIGADTSTTAARFWSGKVAALLVTQPLSTQKASDLLSYLMARRNI